jgi:phage shock protein A
MDGCDQPRHPPQYASREGADEQIGRLRRDVEALKKQIGELTDAQQQATASKNTRRVRDL